MIAICEVRVDLAAPQSFTTQWDRWHLISELIIYRFGNSSLGSRDLLSVLADKYLADEMGV